MKRLLVPLDGSPLAETILPVAEEWAKEEQAEVVLLRAVPAPATPGGEGAAAEAKTPEDAEAYLETVAERLARRGIERVRWGVSHEPPAAAIIEAAAREGVEMIAMATHGRSGLGRLLLGSVAAGVLRTAPAPVLLFKTGSRVR